MVYERKRSQETLRPDHLENAIKLRQGGDEKEGELCLRQDTWRDTEGSWICEPVVQKDIGLEISIWE